MLGLFCMFFLFVYFNWCVCFFVYFRFLILSFVAPKIVLGSQCLFDKKRGHNESMCFTFLHVSTPSSLTFENKETTDKNIVYKTRKT